MKRLPTLPPAICLSVLFGLSAGTGMPQEPQQPAPVNPPGGAVLYFDFEAKEKDGAVPDSSGQKNHGTVSGAKQTTAGKKGNAYQFSSVNGSIRVPHRPALHSEQFTLGAWFRTDSPSSSDRHILDNGKVVIGISGIPENGELTNKDKAFVAINGRPVCYSNYVVTDGAWFHVAATFDGAAVRLYLNGRLQDQAVPFNGKFAPVENGILLGAVRAEKDSRNRIISLNGYLDEVAIYSRALPDDQVKNLTLSIDPTIGQAKYTKRQVLGLYSQIKRLYEDGLVTDEFLEKKVRQLEAGLGDELVEAGARKRAKSKNKSKNP